MQLQTVLFFGLSGGGKGTQAVLLREYLKKNDTARETLYFETGNAFRTLAKEDSLVGRFTKETIENGLLMPSFFTTWLLGDFLVHNVDNTEHMVLDGIPRHGRQAEVVHEAFIFLKRNPVTVVNIEISHETAFVRLKGRARKDDSDKNIQTRIQWFEEDACKALAYFRENNDFFTIVNVDGEKTVDEVHRDIIAGLGI